ncbi:MAG: methylthioribulose 1-phosphate dehydratase [Acaryochloridaceae cyanobacterium SU_2_1]|nr:methylthioribulose 1-phosphate dehydratase [Acaryochloridaceae cyanobacterium SU_2_1]
MLDSSNLRDELSSVIKAIHARGWASGTGGNFSAVLQQHPLKLLMAPSGVDKGLVQPQDLIEVNAQGEVLTSYGCASAETPIHLAIATHAQAGAILHTHSVFSTLISAHLYPRDRVTFTGYEMLKGLAGITTHEAIATIPILANSQDMVELAYNLTPLLPQASHGILLAGHGLYAWGDTLFAAKRHLEILEFLLELNYRQLVLTPH